MANSTITEEELRRGEDLIEKYEVEKGVCGVDTSYVGICNEYLSWCGDNVPALLIYIRNLELEVSMLQQHIIEVRGIKELQEIYETK